MEGETAGGNGTKKKLIFVLAVTAIAGAIALFYYIRYSAVHITTDDAYVTGKVYTIAPKINGAVKEVYVDDNKPVKKGDLIIEIAPEDFDAKVNEAASGYDREKARLGEVDTTVAAARRRLIELSAAVEAARADLELRQATARQAGSDANRASELYNKGFVSKEDLEKAGTAKDVSLAQVSAAEKQVSQATAAVETQKALIRQAQSAIAPQASAIRQEAARLTAATLEQGYTKIYAPADGYVTKKSVEKGNQVRAGQPLMAVASLTDIWVVANYKETQLGRIRPGQKVVIKADTWPGTKFTGTVDSIMAGTGAAFSIFPPENATGNFVKIVQRFPVKITLSGDNAGLLRIGMSVTPTVLVGK